MHMPVVASHFKVRFDSMISYVFLCSVGLGISPVWGNVEPHFVIIFGIKITHLNAYFIIFHVFYVMQIVIQHKVRTNLMFIQLWLLISFL